MAHTDQKTPAPRIRFEVRTGLQYDDGLVDVCLIVNGKSSDAFGMLPAEAAVLRRRLEGHEGETRELVPQTFGEFVQRYGVAPPCEPHEWDNRSSAENIAWLALRAAEPKPSNEDAAAHNAALIQKLSARDPTTLTQQERDQLTLARRAS